MSWKGRQSRRCPGYGMHHGACYGTESTYAEGSTPSPWQRLITGQPLRHVPGRWQFWSAISLLRIMRVKKRNKKGFCRMCGTVGATEIHHVYPGAYRLKSDKNDFVIELCHACHMSIHDDPEKMRALKESTQKAFEKQYSHEEFVRRMGRSWL